MSAATATVPPESELELQHVLFFHRHGDRSPILTTIGANWKTTPEEMAFWRARVATPDELDKLSRFAKVVGDDPSMPPHGVPRHRDMAPLAQLTSIGVEHMFGKGRALRAKYDSFLETHGVKDAPHESVYVLSSNVDRTIQSVQCLLYGMFDGDKADANKEREPAFYVRTYERNILAPEHPIEIFFRLEEVVSEDVAKRDPAERLKMEQLGEKLKVIAGVPADKKVPWTAIRDGLTCRKAHGMPFPEGITEKMYNVMCEYDSWLWHKLFGQKAFCFKAYEHGVQEVYKVLKSFTLPSSEEKPRIAFFSAHDNSIVSLISALELHVDKILPEYGTIVTFEVYQHKESKQYYVKVLFEGKPVAFAGHEPSALCAFEHFELRAKEFLKGP